MSPRAFHHAALPDGFAVVAAPDPPDGIGFRSAHFQLLSNTSAVWSDPAPHQHAESDEMFVVVTGTVIFEVEDREVEVSAGEVCGFPAGLVHSVLRVIAPVHFIVVRAPAVRDKTYVEAVSRSESRRKRPSRPVRLGEAQGRLTP